MVEANDAEVDEKAPETFASTLTISEAREADVDENAPDTFASTLTILEAREADVDEKAPETLVSTVLILLCNALADAFKLWDTDDGVAKLPLTDAAVANPLPAVIVIEPSTERLLPSQLNLSPKLKFPLLSK